MTAVSDWWIVLLLFLAHGLAFMWPRLTGKKTLGTSTYFAITRLMFQPNNITVAIGYAMASAKAGVAFDVARLLPVLLTFAAIFYGGTIYVMNAVSDIEDDRKEKPYRPLPSGKVGMNHAISFAAVNLLLSLIGAFALGGQKILFIFLTFFGINVLYSFVLRPWMSIIVPLIFISITLPLRLYLGSALAGYDLPWPFYALTYQIYVGLQFMRKVIIQKNMQVRPSFSLCSGVQ
jgi:4-hydroxybenzoate polyprenyltransferase